MVSHDREFLSDLTTRTIEFRDHKLYEYLGDINYFLDKRQARDMREVEKRTKTNGASSSDDGIVVLGSEEKKQLQRVVQKAEKRIADLEADIKTVEIKMADPEFYNRSESQSTLQKYKTLKAELDTVLTEWEQAVEQLG